MYICNIFYACNIFVTICILAALWFGFHENGRWYSLKVVIDETIVCRCKVTNFNWITYKKKNFFYFLLQGWINVFYIEYGKNDRIIRNSLAG